MEKVKSSELENAWPSMELRYRSIVVKTITEYQESWISILFKRHGSLYYAKDIDEPRRAEPLYVEEDGVEITDEKFTVGPSVCQESFNDRRETIDFDRGPCKFSTFMPCF
jgi:hypothetical protein